MAETKSSCGEACATDWGAGNARTLAAIWGLPGLAMLASAFATPGVRTLVWTAALAWMGIHLCHVVSPSELGPSHCARECEANLALAFQ